VRLVEADSNKTRARQILCSLNAHEHLLDASAPEPLLLGRHEDQPRSPDAADVAIRPRWERVLRAKVGRKSRHGMADKLPVDEVVRAQDGGTRAEVHSRRRHVVRVVVTAEVNIRLHNQHAVNRGRQEVEGRLTKSS
jgi:hypothetical protein